MRVFGILLALAVLPGLANADGPTRIQAGDTPAEGVHDLVYEVVWQQPAEDTAYLVSFITHAAWDPAGNLCIVEYKQKHLALFDPDGNFLRTLGREGEGPGEMSDARHVFFDGERYGVLQGFPAAIVWLEPDGTPAGKADVGQQDPENMKFVSAAYAVQTGPQIFAWVSRMTFEDGEQSMESWITTVAPDGSLGPALYTPPDDEESARVDDGIDEGKVYDIWMRRWTCDADHGTWVAPERDRFVLQYWNAAGELQIEFTREYEPKVRNEDGADRIMVWFRGRGWTNDQIHVGKTAPVVSSLRLGDDGNLWVRLDQGGRSGDLAGVYDVISPEGRYLRQLRFHCAMVVDSRVILDDRTALALSTDGDGEQWLSLLRAAAPAAGGDS